MGLGTTPRSGGVSLDAVVRFESGAEVDTDAVTSLFRSQVGRPGRPAARRDGVRGRGRPLIRASADSEGDVYENPGLASPLVFPHPLLVGAFVFGFGSSAGGLYRGPVDGAPVILEFEVLDDSRVRITHAGGDAIQRPLSTEYASDGEPAGGLWTRDEPIQAGDSYETPEPVDPGAELVVVRTAEDRRVELESFTPDESSDT